MSMAESAGAFTGGKLNLKGDKRKPKNKSKNTEHGESSEDDEVAIPSASSARRNKRIVHARHGVISAMPLLVVVVVVALLSLLPSTSFALEATFTPNPNDSIENGGTGSGPLPASMAQRRQLLQLEAAIVNSEDPSSTLEHVAKQNGMSSQDLMGVLDRNRHDLKESGQLDVMLAEANAAALGGRGGGGGQGGTASVSLPRRIVGVILSIIASLIRTASVRISRHPGRSTAFAAILAIACLAAHDAPRNGIVISSGSFPPFSRGHTTFLEPPMDYLVQYCVDSRERGSGWTSSLPEPTSKKGAKKRSSSSSSRTTVGGVGMTRSLEIDGASLSCAEGEEGSTEVETSRSGIVEGFELITTARALVVESDGSGEDEGIIDENDESKFRLECMRQSTRSIIKERKFSEFIPGDSLPLKFRSFLVASEDDHDNDAVDEGAVMSMKFLGNFGRYGVQPLRISYETVIDADDDDDDTEADGEPKICSVAFHTLAGGHFDGELRFSIEERKGLGAVVSVTLAIPKGGRAPSVRLAEAMVTSFATSIAQSSRIRTRQTLARRRQSRGYRERVSGRASLKRHLRYEQEKLQEEMAAERKRKWKRNNPDAGHYRPSGHRLKSPNNC
jgi:hypothetical protein